MPLNMHLLRELVEEDVRSSRLTRALLMDYETAVPWAALNAISALRTTEKGFLVIGASTSAEDGELCQSIECCAEETGPAI